MIRHAFLLIAVTSICGSGAAQIHVTKKDTTTAKERSYNLDPIVVTGSGHHQRLKTSTTPVHVLTSAEIREQGITTFDGALTRMLPQVSMAPNSMGSQLRLNGLGNKYILILINGRKLSGDISDNVDLNRVNIGRVKRIEVLDGAASALYGSDAIAGVINIITDQPTNELVAVTSTTRVSGEGQFTESVNLDIFTHGFGSYTSYAHEQAGSYRTNDLIYIKGSDTETQPTIAPLYTGYKSDLISQKFTYSPNDRLAFNAGIEGFRKITDRPATNPDITGGTDYEMRYKGLRWNLGGIYRIDSRNSLQADFTVDRFRYGKEYDVETEDYAVGDYVQSKKQKTLEAEVKGILNLVGGGTTVIGIDWRKDYLTATTGNVDGNAYSAAGYLQHDQDIISNLKATAGVRYTYHETFGSHFTPKVALMYTPGNFNFRATYSNGFRAPGLDELYYHYMSVNRGKAQVSFGNTDLKPETSNYFSLSAGYSTDILAISITGFMNFINDMVVKDNIPLDDAGRKWLREEFPDLTQELADNMTQYATYVNSDKGEVKGFQANVSANIFRGFNLSANYAYTYARSKSGEDWTLLDRSIKNTVTIAANYSHRWSSYVLNVNLNGRMQSKTYYSSYENAPGYGIWNINTTHTFDLKYALIEPSIGIDNIFNRVDDRIDSSLRKYALYSPGRMLTIGLRVKFKY